MYEASSSGPGQYTLVTKYKQELKERNTGFHKLGLFDIRIVFGNKTTEYKLPT